MAILYVVWKKEKQLYNMLEILLTILQLLDYGNWKSF